MVSLIIYISFFCNNWWEMKFIIIIGIVVKEKILKELSLFAWVWKNRDNVKVNGTATTQPSLSLETDVNAWRLKQRKVYRKKLLISYLKGFPYNEQPRSSCCM